MDRPRLSKIGAALLAATAKDPSRAGICHHLSNELALLCPARGSRRGGYRDPRGETHALKTASTQTLLFLGLSAIATGVSWLAYFKALQLAPASHVAPIDKLSLPLTIVLAAVVLGEPLSLKLVCGVALMVVGAMLTLGS